MPPPPLMHVLLHIMYQLLHLGLQPLGSSLREAHAIANLLYEGWVYLPLTVWVYVNYYNLWLSSWP